MKKIDKLVQRVELFERLAVYGDRTAFLKSLAQAEPNATIPFGPPSPNASIDPNAPAPSGVMNMPADNITGLRPIDKNVQSMLNDILVPSGDILPLELDGRIGKNTRDALAKFKAKYNKPASIAAITEVHNQVKNQAVAKTPSSGGPLAIDPEFGARPVPGPQV